MTAAITWFLYCTGVALVLGLAAQSAESAARSVGRPGRWAWLGALVLSVLIPAASFFGLRMWASPIPVLPAVAPLALPELTVWGAPGGTGLDPVRVLLLLWGCATLLLAARVALGAARLRRGRRGWRAMNVSGVPVWVTKDIGPAVFGLRRASILLPAWALTIDEDLQALMLLHEREHLRAGDPWLVAGALATVVLIPWNPALWWQLHRLRLAVEMDCDARVLALAPDARTYGRLLIEVGRRRSAPLPVLALSEPITFLERRIRAFTGAGAGAYRRAALLVAVSATLVLLAVCARDPISPQPAPATDALAVSTEGPVFTPYTVRPGLKNSAQVAATLEKNYPPILREAGFGGTATLWFFIDAEGRVQRMQVFKSSGNEQLDAAALKVAAVMEFTPALNRDRPVSVWVQIPITFTPRLAEDALAATPVPDAVVNLRERSARDARPEADGPVFTPYTVRPSLKNQQGVSAALRENYPPLLREAGIRGTAVLWFHIAEDGRVDDVRIATSSGTEALDQAALRVARTMEFTPALNRDQPVAVWVQIPITFSSK